MRKKEKNKERNLMTEKELDKILTSVLGQKPNVTAKREKKKPDEVEATEVEATEQPAPKVDPGEDLVRLCQESGVAVRVVPGPSACVSALALSGLSTVRFAFEGFLPAQKNDRRKRLEAVANDDRTLIFYEAPHKLRATLDDMAEIFGTDRMIALCRELTKLKEETMKLTLADAVKYYKEKEPRGEYVLVIEGGSGKAKEENPLLSLSPEEHVAHYEAQGVKRMDAIKMAAKDRGMPKSELYKLLV